MRYEQNDAQVGKTAVVRAKAGQTGAVGMLLTDLAEMANEEAGCKACYVRQSKADPDLWLIYGNWRTTADLDAHRKAPHVLAFLLEGTNLLDGDMKIHTFATALPASQTAWA